MRLILCPVDQLEGVDDKTSWASVLEGPLDDIGRRIVRAVVANRTIGLQVFGGVVRASGRPDVRTHLRELLAEQFVAPLSEMFDGPDAEMRAHLFVAQVAGLMFALSVYDDDYLAAAPADGIVEFYGASLQRTATG